ncbi:MAG TPA: hypothetical protein VKI61_05625 [Chitinophagaceae bacterium]|jgi:hypothetical protein|nr:hypothetical protein [Chitinophagaceae bacterium]
MKLFITLTIAVVLFNASFAGSGNPSAVIFPKTFTAALKEKKTLFEAESAKVCACQILRVVSNNESEKFIAVFAQGTNNGDLSANFATATSVLEKEKKHMKDFFFTKIKTAENVTAPTSCSMLYKNIQVKYADIKMYDVLDADALSNKLVTK